MRIMKLGDIKTTAVVGAGTMGQGIAQVLASAGYKAILFDIDSSLIRKALNQINENLKSAVDKSKLKPTVKGEIQSRIQPVDNLKKVKADLIIEAIVEKLELKRDLFSKLEKTNSQDVILATNTSSLSITEIASSLKNPSRFIGLHFFNPANVMKLVEVIGGAKTETELIDLMKKFCQQIGKIAVVAKDSPGFIVNRVARHFYLESLKVLEEKIAGVQTIDKLLQASGFKMGPFELMDLIGVDTNLSVTKSVYDGFYQDSKFRPNRIQQQMVDAGQLGRKTGKGFYDYK